MTSSRQRQPAFATSSGLGTARPDSGVGKAGPGVGKEGPAVFGSAIVAIYLFLITGRILDVSRFYVLHIPLILLVILTLTMLSRGDFGYTISSALTKYFGAFTAWVAVCLPFSAWRFASMGVLQTQVQSFLIFLIIVQVVRTRQDWSRIAGAYAYAILVAALLTFVIGVNDQGRVALPNGTLGDPNEFALHMVLGLPFWWLKASRATGFRKFLFLLYTVPIYVAFARAGSRAGLLAMGMLLLITFLFSEGARKVMIATVVVVGVAASSFVLPDYLKARFTTIFSPSSGNFDAATQSRIESDINSSNERKALLMQSLSMTIRHPVVGVGPGTFSFVSRDERIANGEMAGENLVTHNSYTQASSETGLPGFFFFAATVALAVKYAYTDYHRLIGHNRDLALHARYCFTALSGMALGIFFLSVNYTHLLGVMFALALSLHRIAETSLTSSPAVPGTPASRWKSPLSKTTAPSRARPGERQFSPRPNGRARKPFPTLPVSR